MGEKEPTEREIEQKQEEIKQGVFQKLRGWGDSPLPPGILATLIAPLHLRPFQTLPMLFPPMLLFSSYVNLAGYQRDAAGISAAWSGLYLLLASRRRHQVMQRFSTRGFIRGGALALAAVNMAAGGISYVFGRKGRADTWIGKDSED